MLVEVNVKAETVRTDRLVELKSWREVSVSGDQAEGMAMCKDVGITGGIEDLFFKISNKADRMTVLSYFEDNVF